MSSQRQVAVALRYREDSDAAPRVVAKGWGHVAEMIVKIAKERGVPLHPDRDLAEILVKLELGDMIPENLYAIVAEILAYIYRMNQKAGGSRT
jgi:flagellar biosynthesis protein